MNYSIAAMRCLILLAVLFTQQPKKFPESSGVPKSPSPQVGQQANGAQRNDNAPGNLAIGTAQAVNGNAGANPTDENVQIQRRLVLFTGLLVVVGFTTALVIGWQSWETRKAAEAAAASLKLQEVPLRQWVVSELWVQNPRYDNGQLSEIAIGIPIANETSYPLKLDSVATDLNTVRKIKPVKSLIAPGGNDIHTIWFGLRLEGNDLMEYKRNNFFLAIECSVTFIDVFNEQQTMTFNRLYRCGPQEFEQIDKYTQRQNPD